MLFPELFKDDEVKTKPVFIKMITARYSKECFCENPPEWIESKRFSSPMLLMELFRDLEFEAKEHFLSIHLDGKNRILAVDKVSIGSLNQAIVHPREVFKTALLSSAAAVVLIHNHPSGDPAPSPEDRNITRRLCEGGELLGIKILDHIIIGKRGDYRSFVELGLM